MTFNPVTVITQPRDIPAFLTQCYQEHRSNKYDRLIIQYTPITECYHAARRIFLDNKQYTHYIYATDDIIYSEETFDRLLIDYQKHFANDDDKAVLCTDMNTDQESLNYLRAFMLDKYPVPLLEYGRQFTEYDYHFATRDDEEVKDAIANNDGLVKCCWTAMSLAIIPRYVVENTSFMSDIEYNNAQNPSKQPIDPKWGCCMDVVFAHECREKGFPLYTDMNIAVEHLKGSNKKNLYHKELMQVGKKPSRLFFLNAHTNEEREVTL